MSEPEEFFGMTQKTISAGPPGFAHLSTAHEWDQHASAGTTTTTLLPTVLCVDDDPAVLRAAQRVLAPHFAVTTALSPVQALTIAQKALEPFAVVVADLHMPGLSGIELLQCVRQVSPHTARVLLSGNADLRAAVDAVNTGEIYRFITKPYDPQHLIAMITEASAHHRALAATVSRAEHNSEVAGYVTALNRMLEAIRPDAREAAARIEQRVREIVECCPVDIADDLCAAAALSQIGAASLPTGAAHRTYGGGILSAVDVARADGIPIASAEMLANIPALARAREILYATGLRVPAALKSGKCQGSCRMMVHAAVRISCRTFVDSGLSRTSPTGSQLRAAPLQRSGRSVRAASYTS